MELCFPLSKKKKIQAWNRGCWSVLFFILGIRKLNIFSFTTCKMFSTLFDNMNAEKTGRKELQITWPFIASYTLQAFEEQSMFDSRCPRRTVTLRRSSRCPRHGSRGRHSVCSLELMHPQLCLNCRDPQLQRSYPAPSSHVPYLPPLPPAPTIEPARLLPPHALRSPWARPLPLAPRLHALLPPLLPWVRSGTSPSDRISRRGTLCNRPASPLMSVSTSIVVIRSITTSWLSRYHAFWLDMFLIW